MRRRTAAYRIRPDHQAAVAVLAEDNNAGIGETVEELVAREARARYGPNWRDIVRVRSEGDGEDLETARLAAGADADCVAH